MASEAKGLDERRSTIMATATEAYEAAVALLHKGHAEAAYHKLTRAIMLDPREPKYYKLRAKAANMLQRYDDAISDLRYAVMSEKGSDSQARHTLAKLLFESARFCVGVEKCDLLEEACSLDPLCSWYFSERAAAHDARGEFREALIHATRAIDLDEGASSKPEERAATYVFRAELHRKLGLADAGHDDMKKATLLDPDHAACLKFADDTFKKAAELHANAAACMRSKDHSQAVCLLTKALLLSPDDLKLILTRAAAQRQSGDSLKALADVELAAKMFRDSFTACGAEVTPTSKALLAMGEPLPVREPFHLIRQRNLAHNELALVAMHFGDFEKATTLLNRVVAAEQGLVERGDCGSVDFRFFVNRGDCHHALQELDLAASDFHAAHRSDPSDLSVRRRLSSMHYSVGARLFNAGDHAGAEVELSAAIKLHRAAAYFAARGDAAYFQMKFDDAAADYRDALRLDPARTDVKIKLQQFQPQKPDLPTFRPELRRHAHAATLKSAGTTKHVAYNRTQPTRRAHAKVQMPRIHRAEASDGFEALFGPSAATLQVESLRAHANAPRKRDAQLWSMLKTTLS
ncbi:hypothetical protein M885DRAFT_267529 [Pelagophyceae sp. CCMP2097]|nr:hypothetical protein M885DRAFT_267529 [Pelagophyceae sp. CCMP2097]